MTTIYLEFNTEVNIEVQIRRVAKLSHIVVTHKVFDRCEVYTQMTTKTSVINDPRKAPLFDVYRFTIIIDF